MVNKYKIRIIIVDEEDAQFDGVLDDRDFRTYRFWYDYDYESELELPLTYLDWTSV